ncbi:MAG: biopolymer transporter ExbD [Planctomycetota bacterium]
MAHKQALTEMSADMDMTPMIDVVFNLIIFFMLVSHFSSQVLSADIILPVATESINDAGAKRLVLNVTKSGDYRIMGVKYPPEIIKNKIRAYGILKTVDYQGMQISDMKVMIRADRRTPYKNVQNVYFMLQEGMIWQVCFATLKSPKGK